MLFSAPIFILPMNGKAWDNILCGYLQYNKFRFGNSCPPAASLTNIAIPTQTYTSTISIPSRSISTPMSMNLSHTSIKIGIPSNIQYVIDNQNTEAETRIISLPKNQTDVLELNVVPVDQHLSPPVTLSNGMQDDGTHDCFIASISMALDYFKSQGVLNDKDIIDYRSLVPTVRGIRSPEKGMKQNPAFVSKVTNNKLTARAWYTAPDNLAADITNELKKGNPVLLSVQNWNLLAAHWPGKMEHSILVYGLHDEKIFYIDPWDGARYTMPIQDLVNLDTYQSGSFLITFKSSPSNTITS